MRKFFIFSLIIASVMTTSCSTVRYNGNGKGFSANEEVASNISDLNAAIDASKRNNYTVSENAKIETTDSDGKCNTVYTSTREGVTVTTFKDNSFTRKTKKKGYTYCTNTKFNGQSEK